MPGLARTVLIAESYAALNPTPEMWERYLAEISRGKERGGLTDQQVKTLVYSISARERFLEVTHGDPDAVDEETPFEVLKRHEQELTRPAEERAQTAEERARRAREAAAAATRERDALDARTKEAFRRAKSLEVEVAELTHWKQQVSKVIGSVIALGAVVVAGVLLAIGQVVGLVPSIALGSLATATAGLVLALAFKGKQWLTEGPAQKTFLVVGVAAILCFTVGWVIDAPAGWVGAAFVLATGLLGSVAGVYAHFSN